MTTRDFTYYLNGTIPLTVEVEVGTGDNVGFTSVTDAGGNEFNDLETVGEYVRSDAKPLGEWRSLQSLIDQHISERAEAWQAEEKRRCEHLMAELRQAS